MVSYPQKHDLSDHVSDETGTANVNNIHNRDTLVSKIAQNQDFTPYASNPAEKESETNEGVPKTVLCNDILDTPNAAPTDNENNQVLPETIIQIDPSNHVSHKTNTVNLSNFHNKDTLVTKTAKNQDITAYASNPDDKESEIHHDQDTDHNLLSNENDSNAITNVNEDPNKDMLLNISDILGETQENNTNQQIVTSDTPILHTMGNKRVLSRSDSSNDDECPNGDSDENERPDNHSVHDEDDDCNTDASTTEIEVSNDNTSNPILEQCGGNEQNQPNPTLQWRALPTAPNRQTQNSQQAAINNNNDESSVATQSSSNSEDVPQIGPRQETKRQKDMRIDQE